jgi:hypothetical protein
MADNLMQLVKSPEFLAFCKRHRPRITTWVGDSRLSVFMRIAVVEHGSKTPGYFKRVMELVEQDALVLDAVAPCFVKREEVSHADEADKGTATRAATGISTRCEN